jgi:outer membrane protein TolC
MMEAEQVKMINKILLEAAKDYWKWCYAYYNYKLYSQSIKIAEDIYTRVKANHLMGEAATVDTIQAKITLQQRLIEQQEALIDFQNAGIQLSTYLWDSIGNPLDLSLKFAPILPGNILGVTERELEELFHQARKNHPELQKLTIKLQQLNIDRRLAVEYIKPSIMVNYYMLNQPLTPEWSSSFQLNENYKLGVDFSFPLFIRKERAKLAQTKIKITNTEIERNYTERQIINQISTSYNTLVNNTVIISQQNHMVNNYKRLLQAELTNLENGESDLFKINVQQEKLIQAQSKLIKLLSDYETQKAFLYWSAGIRKR